MDGVQLFQGYSHLEEAVYFLPQGFVMLNDNLAVNLKTTHPPRPLLTNGINLLF